MSADTPVGKYLFVGGPADCRCIVVPMDALTWDLKLLPNLLTVKPNDPVLDSQLQTVTYERQRFALAGADYADVFAPRGVSISEVMVALIKNYKWKQQR